MENVLDNPIQTDSALCGFFSPSFFVHGHSRAHSAAVSLRRPSAQASRSGVKKRNERNRNRGDEKFSGGEKKNRTKKKSWKSPKKSRIKGFMPHA